MVLWPEPETTIRHMSERDFIISSITGMNQVSKRFADNLDSVIAANENYLDPG